MPEKNNQSNSHTEISELNSTQPDRAKVFAYSPNVVIEQPEPQNVSTNPDNISKPKE